MHDLVLPVGRHIRAHRRPAMRQHVDDLAAERLLVEAEGLGAGAVEPEIGDDVHGGSSRSGGAGLSGPCQTRRTDNWPDLTFEVGRRRRTQLSILSSGTRMKPLRPLLVTRTESRLRSAGAASTGRCSRSRFRTARAPRAPSAVLQAGFRTAVGKTGIGPCVRKLGGVPACCLRIGALLYALAQALAIRDGGHCGRRRQAEKKLSLNRPKPRPPDASGEC